MSKSAVFLGKHVMYDYDLCMAREGVRDVLYYRKTLNPLELYGLNPIEESVVANVSSSGFRVTFPPVAWFPTTTNPRKSLLPVSG